MLTCLFFLTCHHVMTYCVERWRLIRSPSTGDRTIGGHGPESQVRLFYWRALTEQCCPGRFLPPGSQRGERSAIVWACAHQFPPLLNLAGKVIRKDGAPADSAPAAGSSTLFLF